MAEANKEIFSGGMYEFLIGEKLVPFAMHKVLVSRYSDRLHDMMSSGDPLVHEVDTETFARFVEWAYTGTYTAAAPEKINDAAPYPPDAPPEPAPGDSPSSEAAPEPRMPIEGEQALTPVAEPPAEDYPAMEAVQDPDDWAGRSKKKKKKAKRAEQISGWIVPEVEITATYEACVAPVEIDDSSPVGPFIIEDNTTVPNDSELSNSAHFLSHAKLWSFANKNGITELCGLTTRRLSSSLQDIRYHQERVEDLNNLVKYVYVFPGDGNQTLRRAVASYTSAHLEELVQTQRFERLLRKGGQFVADTCHLLGQRLRDEHSRADLY